MDGSVVTEHAVAVSCDDPPITRQVLGIPVEHGAVPAPWDAALAGPGGCADHDRLLLHHGDAALYLEHGSRVVLEVPDELRESYDFLLYTTAQQFLLAQQHRFALHAVTLVSPGGACVAIAGRSGAGKSSTTAVLLRRGWRLACDDTPEVVVRAGEAVTLPQRRPSHLGPAALALLGAPATCGRALPHLDKRAVMLEQDLSPRPLGSLVLLDTAEAAASVTTARLGTGDALTELARGHSLRGFCLLPQLRGAFLAWVHGMAASVPVTRVTRAAGASTLEEVADAVEEACEADSGCRPLG